MHLVFEEIGEGPHCEVVLLLVLLHAEDEDACKRRWFDGFGLGLFFFSVAERGSGSGSVTCARSVLLLRRRLAGLQPLVEEVVAEAQRDAHDNDDAAPIDHQHGEAEVVAGLPCGAGPGR